MRIRDNKCWRGFILFCILLLCAGVQLCVTAKVFGAEPDQKTSFRIALQWLPQSQFAGYYMARDLGFYENAGLDMELIHTGPGPSSLDFLALKKADLATMFLADAIIYSRRSMPLVLVAQIVHRSNLMLVAWRDMGVVTPADLDGNGSVIGPALFPQLSRLFFANTASGRKCYPSIIRSTCFCIAGRPRARPCFIMNIIAYIRPESMMAG